MLKVLHLKRYTFSQYSERVGTAASKRGDNVPKQEKERRAAVMIEETEKIRHDYLKKLVGTNEKVLFENEIEPNLFQRLYQELFTCQNEI